MRVVDPHRPALLIGHEDELLPVARDLVQPGVDRVDEVVIGGRVALEDEDPGDVHVGAVVLQVQECGIERGQAVAVSHVAIVPATGK